MPTPQARTGYCKSSRGLPYVKLVQDQLYGCPAVTNRAITARCKVALIMSSERSRQV